MLLNRSEQLHTEDGRQRGVTYQLIAEKVQRSANAVKCRWHSTLKKRTEESPYTDKVRHLFAAFPLFAASLSSLSPSLRCLSLLTASLSSLPPSLRCLPLFRRRLSPTPRHKGAWHCR